MLKQFKRIACTAACVAALALAGPALAQQGMGQGQGQGMGHGQGMGQGQGQGTMMQQPGQGMGQGMGTGMGVMMSRRQDLGQYMTDANGMALYSFKNDSKGKSACTGECLAKWPPFHMGQAMLPQGMNAKDFGTITREDGKPQTTFRGMPMYYFAGDKKSGEVNGQGLKDAWYVMDPARFMMR